LEFAETIADLLFVLPARVKRKAWAQGASTERVVQNMNESAIAFAKLAGIRKVLQSLLDERVGHPSRPNLHFSTADVATHFESASRQGQILREKLPALFGDFPHLPSAPEMQMAPGSAEPVRYGRKQLDNLARWIDQAFEVRAHSELKAPSASPQDQRVFISHGRAPDWREVQSFIERDVGVQTLELAQEPNLGRTVLQKLEQESSKCTCVVIVMTGDDIDAAGNARARENVLHEIGFFQGRFGLSAVCLLHEEGTNIPSNIHGLVYIPFSKGYVSATFGALTRELKILGRPSSPEH
jgi:predicted nucleotide-binding protein